MLANRKMKDSGIEWIGEIPEDWDIVKIKHLCNFYNGYAFDSSDFKFDGNCSVIRIGDISQGTINLDTCAKVEADSNALEKYALKKDDIVIALSGATGRVSGPHLHFGILVRGAQVDPLDFITQVNALFVSN